MATKKSGALDLLNMSEEDAQKALELLDAEEQKLADEQMSLTRKRAALMALLGKTPAPKKGRGGGRRGRKPGSKGESKPKSKEERRTTKNCIRDHLKSVSELQTIEQLHQGAKAQGWTCNTTKGEQGELNNIRQAVHSMIKDGELWSYNSEEDGRSALYHFPQD